MIDTTPFLTSGQYSEHQKSSSMGQDDLGRDAFLTLLTTQLTNQNPLEPMDNEAFVAQLAQFSTVEGIKGMQGSLEDMASGVRQEQMMSGALTWLVRKLRSREGYLPVVMVSPHRDRLTCQLARIQ